MPQEFLSIPPSKKSKSWLIGPLLWCTVSISFFLFAFTYIIPCFLALTLFRFSCMQCQGPRITTNNKLKPIHALPVNATTIIYHIEKKCQNYYIRISKPEDCTNMIILYANYINIIWFSKINYILYLCTGRKLCNILWDTKVGDSAWLDVWWLRQVCNKAQRWREYIGLSNL